MPNFFPPRPATHPIIYAYEDTNPQFNGLPKVGYTSRPIEVRTKEHYPTKVLDGVVPYLGCFMGE